MTVGVSIMRDCLIGVDGLYNPLSLGTVNGVGPYSVVQSAPWF